MGRMQGDTLVTQSDSLLCTLIFLLSHCQEKSVLLLSPSSLPLSLPPPSHPSLSCLTPQVMELIRGTVCQPPPPGCPREIYNLMIHCWWVICYNCCFLSIQIKLCCGYTVGCICCNNSLSVDVDVMRLRLLVH